MPDLDVRTQQSLDKLPKLMRRLREKAELTQVEAASHAGITSTAVAYMERGLRLPRIDTLCALLEVYGSSLQLLAVDLCL